MDAPVVAVSNDGTVGAAWMDMRAGKGNRDVMWTVGKPGKLAAEVRASDDGAGTQGHPSLAFDREGTLWCAWEDARGGDDTQRIHVADFRSKKDVALTAANEGKCAFPCLCNRRDALAVVYETRTGVSLRTVAR